MKQRKKKQKLKRRKLNLEVKVIFRKTKIIMKLRKKGIPQMMMMMTLKKKLRANLKQKLFLPVSVHPDIC